MTTRSDRCPVSASALEGAGSRRSTARNPVGEVPAVPQVRPGGDGADRGTNGVARGGVSVPRGK